MKLARSSYLNVGNFIFIKLYDSRRLRRKLVKERYFYYEVLDTRSRSYWDWGCVFRLLGYSVWCRKWRMGNPVENRELSDEQTSQIVNKMIEIHSLKVPKSIKKELGSAADVLRWLDNRIGTCFAAEWESLIEGRSDKPCVVHGDFQPKKHAIALEDEITIIDFGDSFLGHPSVDLGAAGCSNPGSFEKIFSLYNSRAERPVSRELVVFWRRVFERSNFFWMEHKLRKTQTRTAFRQTAADSESRQRSRVPLNRAMRLLGLQVPSSL